MNPPHTWQQKVAEAVHAVHAHGEMAGSGISYDVKQLYPGEGVAAIAQHTADLIDAIVGEDEELYGADEKMLPNAALLGERNMLRAEQRRRYQDMRGSSNG